MIAVQGPRALDTLQPLFNQPLESLRYYHLTMGRLLDRLDVVISRTGYTGEDGFEVIIGAKAATEVWEALLESGRTHGIKPCGLGARDTLRLEAAMPLYGHELTEEIDPFSAGVGWAVKLDKGDFVGRDELLRRKESPGRRGSACGSTARGSPARGPSCWRASARPDSSRRGPSRRPYKQSIAMALVSPDTTAVGTELSVDVRGHRETARVVKLPFYKRKSNTAAGS